MHACVFSLNNLSVLNSRLVATQNSAFDDICKSFDRLINKLRECTIASAIDLKTNSGTKKTKQENPSYGGLYRNIKLKPCCELTYQEFPDKAKTKQNTVLLI